MSDQVFEFKPVKAKYRIEIEGQSHFFKRPSVGELEELELSLNEEGASKKYVHIYKGFFEKLGLKSEVIKSLDYDDFVDLIKFVNTPKKKD